TRRHIRRRPGFPRGLGRANAGPRAPFRLLVARLRRALRAGTRRRRGGALGSGTVAAAAPPARAPLRRPSLIQHASAAILVAGVLEEPGSILTFDPEAHVYRVDGAPVPSVTELLEAAGISPDYSKVHPAGLRHARLRGIHVHLCCDLDDADDLDWSSVHPEAVGYVQAWRAFKADYGYHPLASQVILYHPTYGYAGTTDSVGDLDGYVTIVERKATAKMAASYAL